MVTTCRKCGNSLKVREVINHINLCSRCCDKNKSTKILPFTPRFRGRNAGIKFNLDALLAAELKK
jgi:hypothetical protein